MHGILLKRLNTYLICTNPSSLEHFSALNSFQGNNSVCEVKIANLHKFNNQKSIVIAYIIPENMISEKFCISFTSYKEPIRISNFCSEFLFTYFISKYWQDKSFTLRPKYIKKCQYNSLHKENKNTLQHLKLGKLKFGIGKIGCLMSWTRYKFRMIVIYTMKRLCCAVLGAALGNHHITIEWLSKTRVTSRYVSSKSILSSKISTQQKHSN